MLMLEIRAQKILPVADEKTVLLQAMINAEWSINSWMLLKLIWFIKSLSLDNLQIAAVTK